MTSNTWVRWAGIALACMALAACGGGEGGDTPAPPPPVTTIIGAAGGTVTGPSGASVVIPAGALAANVTVQIAQTSAGAPALPTGLTAIGAMFAFTPHGTTFAVSVTVTLPFDPATVPAGRTPQLFKTINGQTQWEQVTNAVFGTNTVTAQITSFSLASVVLPPLLAGKASHQWEVNLLRGDGLTEVPLESGVSVDTALNEFFDYGGLLPFPGGISLPGDGFNSGEITASADGKEWSLSTESAGALPNGDIGSRVEFLQRQAFFKRADNASLSFTLTEAVLETLDGRTAPCPVNHRRGLVCDMVKAEIFLQVEAFTIPFTETPSAEPFDVFFRVAGGATVVGIAGSWDSGASAARFSMTPLWTTEDFDFTVESAFGVPESQVTMRLRQPRTFTVDLSKIAVGQAFFLQSFATVTAYSRDQSLDTFPSGARALLRDPLSIRGATITQTGLEPVSTGQTDRPPDAPVPPAQCTQGPGPNPSAGTIQFSEAAYTQLESSRTPSITVTRADGSVGAVTATISTSNGTAIAGRDYTAMNSSVFFADGDSTPRTLSLDLINDGDASEADSTVNLTLSQPGGCAALGVQATTVVTIRDDEEPPPPPPLPTFTIGGTVTGLVGSGLRLEDLRRVPITVGNGPFTFTLPTTDGQPYAVSVVTQPSNPLQICTVNNGSGTVAGANITNVAVSCTTPSANSALDLGFGSAGKVTSPGSGFGSAVAVQADGKIVTVGGSFTLTRHNPDGSPDTGFGALGRVNTVFNTGASGTAADVAIQADGKIIVAGRTRDTAIPGGDNFGVRRYNADGSPDTSFGTLGLASVDFAGLKDEASAVAVQSDGKIVVAGTATGTTTDFALVRLNIDGSLDASFGTLGKQITDVAGGFDTLTDMAIQLDGKIVALGKISNEGSNTIELPALVRYSSNGTPDASFGTLGKVIDVRGQPSDALALQADGKIVVGGTSAPGTINAAFALKRYLADGRPDSGFGTAGFVSTPFAAGSVSSGRAVAIQADGKIVLAGDTSGGGAVNSDIALVRYTIGGQPDASFGTAGILLVDFFAAGDFAGDIAMAPDGKAVVAGSARNGFSTELALLRTNP